MRKSCSRCDKFDKGVCLHYNKRPPSSAYAEKCKLYAESIPWVCPHGMNDELCKFELDRPEGIFIYYEIKLAECEIDCKFIGRWEAEKRMSPVDADQLFLEQEGLKAQKVRIAQLQAKPKTKKAKFEAELEIKKEKIKNGNLWD